MANYLILGTGIAGFSAASEIRKLDSSAEITMVGAEKPYLRPLLSKTDLRTFQRSKIQVVPENWYEENRITLLSGVAITALNPENHTAALADGRVLSYDKCIYALGARSFVPPISGCDKQGVLTLRSTQDFHTLRRLALTAKSAVLIGGGVIGLEMAQKLHEFGLKVTVLEAAPHLLSRQIDSESAQLLLSRLENCGISCQVGVQIAAITGENAATGVLLSDGRQFPAEIVIFCTGIRPEIAIAENAGLSCGRGVMTDDFLVTSHPDILAAGDCLQCAVPNPGLWSFAQRSGEIAGHNAVLPNNPQRFDFEKKPLVLPELGLFAVGDTAADACVTTQNPGQKPSFLVNPHPTFPESYQKRFYRDGKLVGAVLLGDLSPMADILKNL